ncbi:MAG: hypothetical protein H6976_08445 [Gammaproteobacteria bacterium]|nr:hypothetical protein [Gammaproteobacteria bacterium]
MSQKSADLGNASYYYSYTRLPTAGVMVLNGQAFQVAGASWLDREWSTSALGPEQSGWDWFALQLDDGRDVMFYRLRRKDGGTDSFSKVFWLVDRVVRSGAAACGGMKWICNHWANGSARTPAIVIRLLGGCSCPAKILN